MQRSNDKHPASAVGHTKRGAVDNPLGPGVVPQGLKAAGDVVHEGLLPMRSIQQCLHLQRGWRMWRGWRMRLCAIIGVFSGWARWNPRVRFPAAPRGWAGDLPWPFPRGERRATPVVCSMYTRLVKHASKNTTNEYLALEPLAQSCPADIDAWKASSEQLRFLCLPCTLLWWRVHTPVGGWATQRRRG